MSAIPKKKIGGEMNDPLMEGRLTTRPQHRILIATDGSGPSEAGLSMAVRFPWPASSRVRGVVARSNWLPVATEHTRAAVEKSFEDAAASARRVLARRWPEAEVVMVDAPPIEAILAEAKRFEATVIVLGWRGHGTFHRLLAGSVSRSVAAHANCSVLVVREAAKAARRFVVGFDGCPNAESALDFLSSLEPIGSSRAVLVNVVEPLSTPHSLGRFPSSLRAQLQQGVEAHNKEQYEQGKATVDAGAARLRRASWAAASEVRIGAPLASLLEAVAEHRANVLVVGARATNGVERALLGSVASGALNNSPVVLLVR